MTKLRISKKINLKTKLFIAFALILIIPTISIGISSVLVARDTLYDEFKLTIKDNLNTLNISIENSIEPKISDVDKLSNTIHSNMLNENKKEIEKILAQYVEFHPEVEAAYVGFQDGSLIIYPEVDLGADFDARERGWYKEALNQKGQATISDPYISAATDEITITVSKNMKNDSGVVGLDLKLSTIQQLAEQIKIGEEGYSFLADKNQNIIVHPKEEPGTKLADSIANTLYNEKSGNFEYDYNGTAQIMEYTTNELTGWKIAGTIYKNEIDAVAKPIINRTILVIVIAVVIGGLIVYFIIRSIVLPIRDLKDRAITVSKGDLTGTITVNSSDEVGQLAKAFSDMQENLKSLVRKIEQNAEHVAASAEELSASSEETTATTQQVSANIQQVSSSVEKQKESVEAIVQALSEVASGANHIAEYSSKVSELTVEATRQAQDGGKSVEKIVYQMEFIHQSVLESNNTIQSLYERSKQIDSILKIITNIAEQTNLLSLNASIEAARAGEHGKGFAVVANEVKKLAEQSHQSAKDIQEIISAIQNDTDKTVSTMTHITKEVESGVNISSEALAKIEDIIQSLNKITPQMSEVSATAHQVSSAIQETKAHVNENAILAQNNAAISEEVAASSEQQLEAVVEISAAAQELAEMAEELSKLISNFKY